MYKYVSFTYEPYDKIYEPVAFTPVHQYTSISHRHVEWIVLFDEFEQNFD